MYDGPAASDDEELEELLRDGLGDAGARGGGAGGAIGGGAAGGLGGRFGGRLGGRLAGALLPVRRHEEEIGLALPAELVSDVLAHHGRVVWARDDRVRGVVGAGALGMNPAVVDVHIGPGGRTLVRAAAKEGLIPQRTAQKAVRKVIESLLTAHRGRRP